MTYMTDDTTRRAPTPPAPQRGGIGFCGLLTVVFIALKLGGIIGWSWWWILAPLWIPCAIAIGLVAISALCAAVIAGLKA